MKASLTAAWPRQRARGAPLILAASETIASMRALSALPILVLFLEERGLLRQGVPALLADVQDVQHRRAQVRQRCDALRRGWSKSED